MRPILRAAEISRKLRRPGQAPVTAVEEVRLELCSGDRLMVRGPTACGKSSLIQLLAGLDRPDRGWVELFGQRLDRLSESKIADIRRQWVGIVFQDFNLVRGIPSWENVTLSWVPEGMPADERRRRALVELDRFGAAETADRSPEQLTDDQRQRVAVTRALIRRPDLILADEPTSHVDPVTAHEILERLQQEAALGAAVVLCTRDENLLCEGWWCLRMEAGRLDPCPGTPAMPVSGRDRAGCTLPE